MPASSNCVAAVRRARRHGRSRSGRYMAAVYGGRPTARRPATASSPRSSGSIYRILRVDPDREQRWNVYAIVAAGVQLRVVPVRLRCSQRLQGALPFNPTNMAGVAAVRRVQHRRQLHDQHELAVVLGELTMSHLTQMLGLAVQNFVSAAAGMAVAVAIIRGITRRGRRTLGNFWVDLDPHDAAHPAAAVVRRRRPARRAAASSRTSRVTPRPRRSTRPSPPRPSQSIPGGPVASQIAIKQLGTNGGGFFNTNSAHPFENPTGDHQLHRDLGDPASSRSPSSSRTAIMVGSKTPGPRAARRDGRHLARRSRVLDDGRRADPATRDLDRARRRPGHVDATRRREHGGQGGPLRAGDVRPVGGDRRPARRTARSTACTTASRRSAG